MMHGCCPMVHKMPCDGNVILWTSWKFSEESRAQITWLCSEVEASAMASSLWDSTCLFSEKIDHKCDVHVSPTSGKIARRCQRWLLDGIEANLAKLSMPYRDSQESRWLLNYLAHHLQVDWYLTHNAHWTKPVFRYKTRWTFKNFYII